MRNEPRSAESTVSLADFNCHPHAKPCWLALPHCTAIAAARIATAAESFPSTWATVTSATGDAVPGTATLVGFYCGASGAEWSA